MKSICNKIFIITIFSLSLAGFTFPQHHNDDQKYDDRKTPAISDKTVELLDKIKEKLDELDADYLRQLHREEYSKASRELQKIYGLIEAIKKQKYPLEEPPAASMNETEYRALVNSINNESFEENKIDVLQAAVKYSYFTVDQVIGLMDLSTFSSWKLKALDLTYPFVIDKNNSFKIINSLTFSADKQKAQKILDRN